MAELVTLASKVNKS